MSGCALAVSAPASPMGHATIDNKTSLSVEHLFLTDEEGRSVLVVLAQATFRMTAAGHLTPSDEPEAPTLTGELWGKDADVASYKIEPAFAFTKLATDVVLIGHATGHRVTEINVTFRVGPLTKVVRVVGERYWVRSAGAITATRPQPFDRLPLLWENAFGGWDRSHRDPAHHTFEPQNPVGTGFRAPDSGFSEGVRLPNLEDPSHPLQKYGQVVVPAGFGFTSPNWQPRASFAGTYDEAWTRDRMPLLPRDFDRRFFNAAPPGLIAPGILAGNEPVLVDNVSPRGRLTFWLPGMAPPLCRTELVGKGDCPMEMRFDTLVVDADTHRVLMLYRGHLPLRDGPHDVRTVVIEPNMAGAFVPVPREAQA